ncbi:hypothetical protein MR626_02315 [bacterium]|nr:hypothetical protein [bacterium]
MAEFLIGFEVTGRVLLRIAGVCAAALLLVLAVLLALIIASVLFDWITTSLGRRWEQKKHKPRNRLERIILDACRSRGD